MADNFGFRPIFYITGTLLFLASVITWLLVHEKFDRAAAAMKEQVSVLKGFRDLMVIRQLPVLLTVTFLIQFAMLSPMPLIPLYVQHLHGTSENLAFYAGFVGSVTGISNMICSPVLGKLSDRIGATRILLICLAGSAVMTIPQAFADSVGMLLVFRFLLGCFMGGLIPTVNALVRHYTPDGKESRAFGFNTSALSLGNMMGPVVGGALSGWIGIEGLFILAGVLLFLTCIWATRALRSRQRANG